MGFIKGIINAVADPRLFFLLAVAALVVVVWKREVVAENAVGYGLLGVLGLFFAFGTFDPNFRLIVTKPDNVPIVGLIFLLVFFVWYSIREGVLNDRRIVAGQGPIEQEIVGAHLFDLAQRVAVDAHHFHADADLIRSKRVGLEDFAVSRRFFFFFF